MSDKIKAAGVAGEPVSRGEPAADFMDGPNLKGDEAAEISAEELIEKLSQEVDTSRVKAENYYRSLLRLEADFANFRRRTQQEKEELQTFAAVRVITDLLPILDNLERGLDAAEKSRDFDGLLTGLQLVYRGFKGVLIREGLQRIEAFGQQFDPNLHEAVLSVPAAKGQEDNQVVQELQTGYKIRDRVIRPSRVAVAKGPAENDPGNKA